MPDGNADGKTGDLVSETSRPVLISQATADAVLANDVCAALERGGVRCWIAPRDVMPGTHYASDAARAIVLGALISVAIAGVALERLWPRRDSAVPATMLPTTAHEQASAPATVPEKSITVLPFTDLSEKHDQGYFADRLAETLLDLLAKTPGLHVIARTSSFSFKGKSDDIPAIAGKLQPANILDGSVRKAGSHLRVTTQPISASMCCCQSRDCRRSAMHPLRPSPSVRGSAASEE